ncbi:MAG: RsmE family RNA methyltransferase [Candidatus Gracilibacteria bacterium]|jgi:16S rRNA (uracil1498-N3)-methyltransferase
MNRFYKKIQLTVGETIEVKDADLAHQVNRVLRVRVGEKIAVFNGDGVDFICEVTGFGRDMVSLKVLDKVATDSERPVRVHLYQAIPHTWSKFEDVLKKCTELGAVSFYPVKTKRSETFLRAGDEPAKKERLTRILIEATEQCGGSCMPELGNVIDFDEACKSAKGVKIMAYEKASANGLSDIKLGDEISVFIGPEGGFTQEEADMFEKNGGEIFHLGKRILRTETAPTAILGKIFFD